MMKMLRSPVTKKRIYAALLLLIFIFSGCGVGKTEGKVSAETVQPNESAAPGTPGAAASQAPASKCVSPSPSDDTTITIKAEYFIKGLCGAIHSIFFDEGGNMYVGSLGDTSSSVGKKGIKKVYKISPDKSVETIAEVECTFITAVYVSASGSLYLAVLDDSGAKIVRIDKDGNQEDILKGISETGRIAEDPEGNIYVSSDKMVYRISESEVKIMLEGKGGILDSGFKNIYSSEYLGDKIVRFSINGEGIPGEPETVMKGRWLKTKICAPGDILYVLAFNAGDKLFMTDLADGKTTGMIIDVSEISYPRNAGDGWINNMALGTGGFSEDYIYMTTWSGDILRVRLPE